MGRPPKVQAETRSASEIEAEAVALEAAVKRVKKARRALARLEAQADDDDDGEAPPILEPGIPGAVDVDSFPGNVKAQAIIKEMNGEGCYTVERIESNGEAVQMGVYDVGTWPHAADSVIKKRGGGQYHFKFRSPTGAVMGSYMRSFDETTYPGIGKAPAQAGSPAAPSFLEILALMDRRDAAHREELAILRAEMARAAASKETMLLEFVRNQQSPFLKSAQDFAAMSKIFERKSALEELADARDFLEDLKGNSRREAEDENPVVALLRPLATAVTAALAPKIVPAPLTVRQPGTASTPAPGQEGPRPLGLEAPPPGGAAPVLHSLEIYRVQLAGAIQGGTEPEGVAALVAEHTEDKTTLLEVLRNGDWDGLRKDAFLSQHWSWVERFKSRLLALLAPPAPSVEPVAPPSAPPTHAPS